MKNGNRRQDFPHARAGILLDEVPFTGVSTTLALCVKCAQQKAAELDGSDLKDKLIGLAVRGRNGGMISFVTNPHGRVLRFRHAPSREAG